MKVQLTADRHPRSREHILIVWPRQHRVGGVARVVENLAAGFASIGIEAQVSKRLPLWSNRRPKILFAKATKPLSLVLLRRATVIIHDVGYLERPSRYSRVASMYFRLSLIAISLRRHTVIVPSRFTYDRLRSNWPWANRLKICIIPWGPPLISRRQMYASESDESIFCPRLGDPRKRADLIAEASRILQSTHARPLTFHTTGINPQSPLARQWNLATHHGTLSEEMYGEIFSQSLVCIYVSSYEGFGLPILEAQSLGVPVVVQKGTACAEILGGGGVACEASPEAVAAATAYCLKHNKKLSQLAIKNAAKFSWETTCEALLLAL